MKLLLLEDDGDLSSKLAVELRRSSFAVDVVSTLRDADMAISIGTYDCLVLDRTVPDGDALVLVAQLRQARPEVPILILTGKTSLNDRVEGFESGADDYLAKPFASVELIARIRALTRRGGSRRSSILIAGDIQVDVPRHRVVRAGVDLSLRAKEFAVLELLIRRVDDVVTRTDFIENCWDEYTDPASNVVDVTIASLRRRLGSPDPIETLRGVGYRLNSDRASPVKAPLPMR